MTVMCAIEDLKFNWFIGSGYVIWWWCTRSLQRISLFIRIQHSDFLAQIWLTKHIQRMANVSFRPNSLSVVLNFSKWAIYHVQPTEVTNQSCRYYCTKASRICKTVGYFFLNSFKERPAVRFLVGIAFYFLEVSVCPGILHILISWVSPNSWCLPPKSGQNNRTSLQW